MAKRKMVQHNLVKNSIAAYFAAVEIHNKPNIPYRYETVTLLIMNAWELILKAYTKRYIKQFSIFEKDGHTISCDKALGHVNNYINAQKTNSFTAIKANIEMIERYRNDVSHFYNTQLTPCIFALVSRSALNYVEFVNKYFQKDIMKDDGLFILPLGFKLPFKPEDFLSNTAPAYTSSPEARLFIDNIVRVTEDLKNQGIEDSLVLGFDVFMQSVKKIENSDILVAITPSKEEATAIITKTTTIRITDDPSAQTYIMSDDEFRSIWKYTHAELIVWCKDNILCFVQGKKFNDAKRIIENDESCVHIRKLDATNRKSASQKFYSDIALKKIKECYELEVSDAN